MRLFRNKKAMDYSSFMTIVVFIVIVYLFIQLNSKLGAFETKIGEQELALINTYQEGDKLLLFVDQSAKYSVYRGLHDFAKNGAFKEKVPCGFSEQRPYWFKDGKKCYEDINFYENFGYHLNEYLNAFISVYPKYIPKDNYEFTITKDKVLGIPKEPILMPLSTDPEKKEHYVDVMQKVFNDFGISAQGLYMVRPAFSLNIQTHIEDFELLRDKVDILLDCLNNEVINTDETVNSCLDSIKSNEFDWVFVENVKATKDYLFHVQFNNIEDPYSIETVFIRFALEIPKFIPK